MIKAKMLKTSLVAKATGVTWLITMVWGWRNRPWALGTLIYEDVKLEKKEKK
jgi:hypothetical protein